MITQKVTKTKNIESDSFNMLAPVGMLYNCTTSKLKMESKRNIANPIVNDYHVSEKSILIIC
jgi:hypothetical protein